MVKRQHRCIGITVITIMIITLIVVLGMQLQVMFTHRSVGKRLEFFERQREWIYLKERYQHLGGKFELSTKEMLVNNRIVTEKLIDKDDDDDQFMLSNRNENDNITNFSGDMSVFFEKIQNRPLFKLLQSMPKGAALHAKDFAMCSPDCLVSLTYQESLWICKNEVQLMNSESSYEYEALIFSREVPKSNAQNSSCKWFSLNELRSNETSSIIDKKLRAHFTLRAGKPQSSLKQFEKLVYGLLTFEPIWSMYIRQSLEQFQIDNILYIEIFSTLPTLYNLENKNFTFMDTARKMREAIKSFCARNHEFVGAMVIYEPPNKATDRDYNKFLERALRLKRTFPDFFAGINLASNIQVVSPLYYLSRKLIALQDEFDFFYHVDGVRKRVALSDENLIDSILLGSKRVTHDTAFLRHPELLHMVQRMRVAVEISPTTIIKGTSYSTSALSDHSSTFQFAGGYPVIITSEYPSFWNSSPLTHDFYLAFVGLTTKAGNLGTLKQLAWNSLQYSSSRFLHTQRLFRLWSAQWEKWINEVTEYEL